MNALYATQRRFLREVLAHGVQRASAAVFLLPDAPERAALERTLACALYHALGLEIIRESIAQQIPLRAALEARGAGGLCLVLLRDIPKDGAVHSRYALPEGDTYPYVKISERGGVDVPDKAYGIVPAAAWDVHISAPHPGEGAGTRFFQKPDGKLQRIDGCDMRALRDVCFAQAERFLQANANLFGGVRECGGS